MESNEPEKLEEIIYVSSATRPFTQEQLAELLDKARRNNNRLDVSGMLVYNEGSFIQVLEGAPETLSVLYNKIEKDSRHRDCNILLRRPIESRTFKDWAMDFTELSNKQVEEAVGPVDFFGDIPVPELATAACGLLASVGPQRKTEVVR